MPTGASGKFWSNPSQMMSLDNPYKTALSPQDEFAFQQWVQQNNVPFEDDGPYSTYDMRGYYKAMMSGDPRAKQSLNPSDNRMHFPDTWKTPYHDSFSNESIYAKPDDPHWEGDDAKGWKLIDKNGQVLHEELPASN